MTRYLSAPGSASAGDLAHITLFRYATPLRDPASLLEWLTATEFHLSVDVSELLVIRERIFPSLDYDVLHHLPRAPASPAAQPATNSRSTIQFEGVQLSFFPALTRDLTSW